ATACCRVTVISALVAPPPPAPVDESLGTEVSTCTFFFFQAEDGIRDRNVTGVQTCALPISYIARYNTSPERSPVNIRPVRFAPCAAGASPTIAIAASGSPKPGTGRPQYSSSRKAARLVCATSSRHSTSRGQAAQSTTFSSSSATSRATD